MCDIVSLQRSKQHEGSSELPAQGQDNAAAFVQLCQLPPQDNNESTTDALNEWPKIRLAKR